MTEFNDDHAFERRVVAALDRRTGTLDPALEQRLDRARRIALAEADAPRHPWFAWPALATAGAAALIALIVMVQPMPGPDNVIPTSPMTEDLDLLTQEEFELFAEDPEFYAWIAERPRQQRERERGGPRGENT